MGWHWGWLVLNIIVKSTGQSVVEIPLMPIPYRDNRLNHTDKTRGRDMTMQKIFCLNCGRELFEIDGGASVRVLKRRLENIPRCKCNAIPYVVGVKFR